MARSFSVSSLRCAGAVAFGLFAASALPSHAVTCVWTNDSSANPKFSDKANWQSQSVPDASSKASKDPKWSEGAEVDFSQVSLASAARPQTIVLPQGNNGYDGFYYLNFYQLVSGPCQILNVDYSQNGASGAAMDTVWVYDASSFRGLITCNPAGGSGAHNQQTLVALFNGTTLPVADGRHNMGYYTHYWNAATIGQFAGAGVVTLGSPNYVGQGTTTIRYPSGPETGFYDRCGVYVLNGYTTDAALVSGAVLHFDASDASTLTVSDGKVASWRDKSGNGIVAATHPQLTLASPCENPGTYVPSDTRLAADSGSGLPVVTFGAPYGNRTAYRNIVPLKGDELGQPGALRLSPAVSGVKEVFFVFRDTVAKGYMTHVSAPFVLGTESGNAALNPFGRLISDSSVADGIFACTGASAMMKTSAVFLDGQRIVPEATYSFDDYSHRLHVVSCGLSDGSGTIETLGLGCDGNGNVFYGGVAVAEVVAYDRTLSDEERHQVNAYLRGKWQPDAGTAWDYGSLRVDTIGSCTGSFQVASGTTAIRDLRPIAKTFDKEGAGTLVIGRLHGFDDYVINVKGGDVRFATPAAPVERRADDPLVWFDATQVTADQILHSNGVDYVKEIVDPRTNGKNHHGMTVKAVRHARISGQEGRLGAYATLQEGVLNGKPVFNFGEYYAQDARSGWGWETTESSAAPYMITLQGGMYMDNVREAFAVVRVRPNSDSAIVDVFGGGGYEIFGGTLKSLINASYTSAFSKSALWRLNGEIVDPTSVARNASDFYLVSVSFPRPLTFNTLGFHFNSWTAGGMDVAEVIAYDRQLTDSERVDTEAYLMKKWFAKDHPYSKPVKVRVNPLSDPTRLTQDGDGTLDVSGVAIDSLTGVEANGGTLRWNFSGADLFLKSQVHLDATLASSLTVTGGNWVTEWADARGNGVAALVDMGASATVADVTVVRPGVSPTLTTATVGGVARNVIDFGDFTDNGFKDASDSNMRTNANGEAATSSAMRINVGNSDSDRGVEFYVVHADAHNLTGNRTGIMGIQEGGSSYTSPKDGKTYTDYYPFLRYRKRILWGGTSGGFSPALVRGDIYVDGVKSSDAYEIENDGEFHLFAFYPEAPVLARALAMRSVYERGGQQLGEVAVFTATNSAATRSRIGAYLMKKWFGSGSGFTLELDDITLADGGTFDFATTDGTPVSVRNVVGDGTVRAPSLAVTETLSFRVLADAAGRGTGVTSLTVDGRLTLPANGTVAIEVPAGLVRIRGSYPLVTATELVGDLSGVGLECEMPSGCRGGLPTLEIRGDTLYADFPSPGMAMFIR